MPDVVWLPTAVNRCVVLPGDQMCLERPISVTLLSWNSAGNEIIIQHKSQINKTKQQDKSPWYTTGIKHPARIGDGRKESQLTKIVTWQRSEYTSCNLVEKLIKSSEVLLGRQ